MDGTNGPQDVLQPAQLVDPAFGAASEALPGTEAVVVEGHHDQLAALQHDLPGAPGQALGEGVQDVKLEQMGADAAQLVAEAAQHLVAEAGHPEAPVEGHGDGVPKFIYLKHAEKVVPFLAVGGTVKPADIGGMFGLDPDSILFAGVRLPTRTDGYYDVNIQALWGGTSEAQPIEVSGSPFTGKRHLGMTPGERASKQPHLEHHADVSGHELDANGYPTTSARTGAQLQLPHCLPAWVREDRLPSVERMRDIYPKVSHCEMQGKGRGGSGGRKSCKICTRAFAEFVEWPENMSWVGMSQHCCVCLLLAVRKDPLEVLSTRQNLTHRELCKGHKCACLICTNLNGAAATAGTPSGGATPQALPMAVVQQPVVQQPQPVVPPQVVPPQQVVLPQQMVLPPVVPPVLPPELGGMPDDGTEPPVVQ